MVHDTEYYKTKALVIRSRTVNPPHGDLVLYVVSICDSSNLDIITLKIDSKLNLEDHVRGIVSPCVSENLYFEVGETCNCRQLCVTSLLLCICSSIDDYYSPVCGSAAECLPQLLERRVYLVDRI